MNWRELIHARRPALVFAVLLAVHGFPATRNIESGFLVGHEFRQAQTAISAHFIRQEANYSLAYPTPVLGKLWSVPLEFPPLPVRCRARRQRARCGSHRC